MIVGAPRSGTTWVQRLLLADPRCCGGQESHFFATFGRVLRDFDRKASLERRHGLACYWRRDALVEEIAALWRKTVAGVVAAAPAAVRLVEKTPDHALWLDVIAQVIPGARVVHVVRDSRAVCASLLAASREAWGRGWAPTSIAAAMDVWRRHVEAVAAFDGAVHRVHYEDLHRDPLGVLEGLWAFAGLEVTRQALAEIAGACRFEAVRERRGEAAFAGTGDVAPGSAEPPGFYREGTVDGWRRALSRRQQRIVWRGTRGPMEALGYDEHGRVGRS
jgi:hypothetical protein